MPDGWRLTPSTGGAKAIAMKRGPSPGAVAWLVALAVAALASFSPAVLNDGDTFSHVATGEWIIAHQAVPTTDPFSFSFAGRPWVAHEWLSELALAAAFRFGNWSGVVALTAAAAGLAVLQLGRHLGRFLAAGPVLLILVMAVACISPTLLARPHILALPVLEAWIAGLVIARSEERAPSWWMLPLMCVWANLHGGFIIGLLLIGPLALEAMAAAPALWRATLARWGAFALSSVGAAMLTPHGPAGLLFPFQLAGLAELSNIGEWQPTDFGSLQPLELVLIAVLYAGLTRGVRLPPFRLVLVLGLLHMSLQHSRHQLLLGMIAPLLLAEPLGAMAGQGRNLPLRPRWMGGVLAIAGLVALRLAIPIARSDGPSAPITAIDHVPTTLLTRPVLNDYAFGGYLIFRHVRPFIDGRADMFGSAFLRQYAELTRPDMTALQNVMKAYAIDWVVLSPGNPANELLDTLPDWCRVYADSVAIVRARSCADKGDFR